MIFSDLKDPLETRTPSTSKDRETTKVPLDPWKGIEDYEQQESKSAWALLVMIMIVTVSPLLGMLIIRSCS